MIRAGLRVSYILQRGIRALRDGPRISKAGTRKVKKTAGRMGYTRDPKISELMSHLLRGQHRTFQGNLALISDHDPENSADKMILDFYQDYALARACELLEPEHEWFPEFFVTDPPSPAAAADLLAWIKQHLLDCIVSQIALAETLDCKLPKMMDITYQGVGPASSQSGIYQSDDSIAETAVETLPTSVEHGRRCKERRCSIG